jgi:hypothetical protein
LWRVSPVRERLKRGASNQARNRKRTGCYAKHATVERVATPRSLLCNTDVAAVGRHATIAATFSERSANRSPRVRLQCCR